MRSATAVRRGAVGRRPLVRRSPRRLRLVALGAAVLAAAGCALGGWGRVPWAGAPVLAVAVALADLGVVHLPLGRSRWAFRLRDAAVGAAWLVGPGAWTVAGVAAGTLLALRVRRRSRATLELPVATAALAAGCGELVVHLVGRGLPAVVAGLAVLFAVDHVLVAVAVATASRRRLGSLLLSSTPGAALQAAGNCSVGLLAVFLATHVPLGLLGLLVPLALLAASYDSQARRGQEVRLFADLADGQERVTERSGEASVQVIVTSAARVFGGADVELVVLAADGPVRYAGGESGRPVRLRVDADVFDEPWVLRALGARGVATGLEDARPWCSVVLGDPAAPQAVLIARRLRGAVAFGRHEVRLARLLSRQAGSWLAHGPSASQADGAAASPLRAAAAPALTVLRESTDRLALLTGAGGGTDDIVEELHLVERAVASLLGAVALAGRPGPAVAGNGVAGNGSAGNGWAGERAPLSLAPAPRASADWTTSGVLQPQVLR